MKKSGYAEWEVDWDFLVQQREVPQRGSMDGVDRVLAMKEKKKIDREEILLKRKQTESFRAESRQSEVNYSVNEGDEESSNDTSDEDSSFEFEVSEKRSPVVNVALPAKNILQATASTAVRMGLSNRQHLAIVSSTINAGNQSALTDFGLSLGTTFRQRQDTIQQVAEVVKKHGQNHSLQSVIGIRN
uniref:Uncharacterized protein n=1 Tax=Daphnia galeata TaxID=27404 RepID=A0A8J2RE79_9CRUS|nr:unnamed protein product [Daphnia galeata]